MSAPNSEALVALRREIGKVLLISGFLSAGVMTASTLYATGRAPWFQMPERGWADMYKTVYYLMVLGGAYYLLRALVVNSPGVRETIFDFALGVTVYSLILIVASALLLTGWISPWISLLPGLCLIYYGLRLRANRPVWKH